MDAKDKCYDNIFMERFRRTLKQENVCPERYETMNQAKRGIDNYMRTYNYQRLHSSIGYIPPMDLYEQQINRAA